MLCCAVLCLLRMFGSTVEPLCTRRDRLHLGELTDWHHAVTAIVAAFVCLFPDQPLEATAHALAYFG